jgi:isocitrate dehydrogenase (NAD+)
MTRTACERICRFAFDYAVSRGRRKVTAVHKANIMKLADGLFLDSFFKVAADYPTIEAGDSIVDAACMRLVMDPHQFDVVVMENLYGDILSDLCSGLVGGLGVTPGANIGDEVAVFESVHGSAPDIAGKNIDRVMKAVCATLADGTTTHDLGGDASTSEYTEAVVKHLEAN